MPTLNNLTPKQKQLCELIWACDTQDSLQLLIKSLPESWRREAVTLYHMIIIECIDEEITEEYQCEQAQTLLQKYHS